MSQQKEESDKKPEVKVQDLAPKKDAKGGRAVEANAPSLNSASADSRVSQDRFSADTKSLD